jgi:hypothetical protein
MAAAGGRPQLGGAKHMVRVRAGRCAAGARARAARFLWVRANNTPLARR